MLSMKILVHISLYENLSALFLHEEEGHIEPVQNIVEFILFFLTISRGIQWKPLFLCLSNIIEE
jgi:hypothetical protein